MSQPAEKPPAEEPQKLLQKMRRLLLSNDAMLDAGALVIVIGIGLYDVRLGIIAAGAALAGASLWGMGKDARNTSRNRQRQAQSRKSQSVAQ